jgi:hypothetical protein
MVVVTSPVVQWEVVQQHVTTSRWYLKPISTQTKPACKQVLMWDVAPGIYQNGISVLHMPHGTQMEEMASPVHEAGQELTIGC